MMDLIVDPVQEQPGDAPLILTERGIDLVEALRWYLRPQRADLIGHLIPEPKNLGLRRRSGRVRVVCKLVDRCPLSRGQSADAGPAIEIISNARAAHGRIPPTEKRNRSPSGEGLDNSPGQPPMPLPVLEQLVGPDDERGIGGLRNHGELLWTAPRTQFRTGPSVGPDI